MAVVSLVSRYAQNNNIFLVFLYYKKCAHPHIERKKERKGEREEYEDQDKTQCQNKMQAKSSSIEMCRHCNNSIDKLYTFSDVG